MNPFSWIIVAAMTFITPGADTFEKMPDTLHSGNKPAKESLLSPMEEAQWKQWEKEWKREEKAKEDEILIEFLTVSNSQMPYSRMD